jgi:hypothetical protein
MIIQQKRREMKESDLMMCVCLYSVSVVMCVLILTLCSDVCAYTQSL